MGLPDRERSLTISSAVWIKYTNVTDGQTPGAAKTALRIASRGKKVEVSRRIVLGTFSGSKTSRTVTENVVAENHYNVDTIDNDRRNSIIAGSRT